MNKLLLIIYSLAKKEIPLYLDDSFNLKDHTNHSQEKINDDSYSFFQNDEVNLLETPRITTQKSEITHRNQLQSSQYYQKSISLEGPIIKAPESSVSNFLDKPIFPLKPVIGSNSVIELGPSIEPKSIASSNQVLNSIQSSKGKNELSLKKIFERNKIMVHLIGAVAFWQFIYYLVYW